MRVLLVEDDPTLGSAVREFLAHDSHVVDWVQTLGAAQACLPEGYAVIVLDRGLPDGDGLSLLPLAHRQPDPPAVLVMTARDGLSDRVKGLDAGADDYLVKPFDLDELAARLRALSRRRSGRRGPRIELGALTIDPARREVRLRDASIEVTASEYALISMFAEHPNQVLTRRQLEDALYTLDEGAESNVVEVYVSRLRRKLGRGAIRTVRGFGYQWGTAGDDTGETRE